MPVNITSKKAYIGALAALLEKTERASVIYITIEKAYRGRTLGKAVGIMALVLLMAGGPGVATPNSDGTPVISSTGNGTVFFNTDTGVIENLTAVNVSDIPEAPPGGSNLYYGLFRFNITGITSGSSVNLTLIFPSDLTANTTYWKYGANALNITPHWYIIPCTINGNKLTLNLTDGGIGDDDLAPDGRIRDDGAPSIPTPDNTSPVINSVKLNTITPNTGEAILVTVNATDNVAVTDVEANGVSLINQGGNIWSGTIIALGGTNPVDVSTRDAAGNTAWDNSTIYSSGNLVANPGFENGTTNPINWTLVNNGTNIVTWDATVSHTGTSSIKISSPGTNSSQSGEVDSDLIQAVPLQNYTFTGWGKTLDAGGDSRPAIRVEQLDANRNFIKQSTLYFDRGTNDWTMRTLISYYGVPNVTTNVATKYFRVYAIIYRGYGTFWVDDVELKFATYTPPPTPTPVRKSGVVSGGGGGGGGGTSGENFSNILVKENYDLYIAKDIVTSYAFTNNSSPIKFVNIIGNTSAGVTNVAVETLKNTSTLINTPAPGIIYKNINIWVGTTGFGGPKNIKEATIIFRVENSWIGRNGLAGSDVKMLRWDGSQWTQIETAQTTKDDEYTYYEAKTNHFSPFAISGMKISVVAAAPVDAVTEIPVMPTGTPKPRLPPWPVAVSISSSAPAAAQNAPGFELVLTVGILSVAYLLGKKRS